MVEHRGHERLEVVAVADDVDARQDLDRDDRARRHQPVLRHVGAELAGQGVVEQVIGRFRHHPEQPLQALHVGEVVVEGEGRRLDEVAEAPVLLRVGGDARPLAQPIEAAGQFHEGIVDEQHGERAALDEVPLVAREDDRAGHQAGIERDGVEHRPQDLVRKPADPEIRLPEIGIQRGLDHRFRADMGVEQDDLLVGQPPARQPPVDQHVGVDVVDLEPLDPGEARHVGLADLEMALSGRVPAELDEVRVGVDGRGLRHPAPVDADADPADRLRVVRHHPAPDHVALVGR
ncbi:hypothetical protein CHKEEEPN_3705 [Methylorubrum podarium]|nr:hypothetical protein CHKEEEPN_3705 [Methylorubrum podarium]